MDQTRVTMAQVLAYGVPMTWQQAGAILVDVAAATHDGPSGTIARIRPDCCVLTRAGEVQLTGEAPGAGATALTGLAKELLGICVEGGDLAHAVADNRLLDFLAELRDETPWKRRRVQIATVALDTLSTHFDRVEHGLETVAGPRAPRPALMAAKPAAPEAEPVAAPGAAPLTRQAPRASAMSSVTRRPWPEVREQPQEEAQPERPRGLLKLAFWSR